MASDLLPLLQKYDDFANLQLKPKLKSALDARDEVFNSISEYQKLRAHIEMIQAHNLTEIKSMVDLGSQFYAQAHIPDTSYIYVNIGFGFHVQFTLEEAKTFIDKKEKHLQSSTEKYSQEADKIRAHIKMVLEAMDEILHSKAKQ